MRLIDADALLEAIYKIYGANHAPQGIINLITNAPTIQREERDKLVNKTDKGAATLRPIDIEKLAVDCEVSDGMFLLSTEQKENLQKFAEAYASKVLEDKEREIAELKQERNDLNYLCMDRLHNIEELQAHINDLRDDLEAECGGRCNAEYNPCHARQAISKTPAQSLQEFENEVIERCAKLFENGYGTFSCDFIQWNIRALKVTND